VSQVRILLGALAEPPDRSLSNDGRQEIATRSTASSAADARRGHEDDATSTHPLVPISVASLCVRW
jgi:hypothetical protein